MTSEVICSKITELRHILHSRPELSLQECDTIRILQEFLRSNTSLEIWDRDGWFYAVKRGRKQENAIAFRADMDALPMEDRKWGGLSAGTYCRV